MDSAVRAAEKEVKKGELEGEQKFRQMEAHFLTNTTSWNSMTNAERKTALESEMLYLNKLNEIFGRMHVDRSTFGASCLFQVLCR